MHWWSLSFGVFVPFILVAGYQGVFLADAESGEVTGEIVAIQKGNIDLSIKALGNVTLANEQQMRFNVLGKVEKIHVNEGDSVQRDQIIAELEKTDPLADIRQAELSVGEAWLRLQELEASKDQQILAAQNSVREYERQLEAGYGELPSEQQSVDSIIEQAKRTVLEKEKAYDKSVRDLALSVQNAIASSDAILDKIFAVLSGDKVRGSTRNTTFEIDFLFNDQSLKNDTEWRYYDATNAYFDLVESYPQLINETNVRTLYDAVDDAITLMETVIDLSNVSYDFLQTAVPSAQYSDADFNTLKATINTQRTSAISVLNGLKDQGATLTSLNTNTASQALEKAKEDLKTLELQKQNGTTNADAMERSVAKINDNLRNEQAKLESTKTSVDVQISQQQNTLSQRNVSLEKAKRKLEDYELRAPFDGIVRRIDFQVGDNLLADAQESKYVVLENPAYLIVTVQLDQVDVVHVKEGQKAFITFDALPDKQFEGVIDVIDTTPIQTSGVVSYAIEIALQPTGDTILSGMTAKVEIQTASKEGIVLVPSLAIRQSGNMNFVTSESGQRIPIEIGITDGEYTEVLSGLEEGDRIYSISVSLTSEAQTPQSAGLGGAIRIPGASGRAR